MPLSPYGSLAPYGSLLGPLAPSAVPPGPKTIRQAVLLRLRQSSDLAAIVGDRISSQAVPQLSNLPAATLSIPSNSPGRNLDGADGSATATVRVSIWARSQGACDLAAEAVRNRFDGFAGTIGLVDVLGAFVGTMVDLPEAPADKNDRWTYRTLVPLSITYRLPLPNQLQE